MVPGALQKPKGQQVPAPLLLYFPAAHKEHVVPVALYRPPWQAVQPSLSYCPMGHAASASASTHPTASSALMTQAEGESETWRDRVTYNSQTSSASVRPALAAPV